MDRPYKIDKRFTQEMEECIQNCQDCHSICVITSQHFLDKGGEFASTEHVRLLLDCAHLCQTSADFMLRGSDMHSRVCAVCAEVCQRCAADCERMAGNDEQIKACADICLRCAESCRIMASVMAA